MRNFAEALKVCDAPGRVPEHLRNFWRRPDKMEAELKHQAKTGDYIEDVLAMVAGQAHLVDQYLDGTIRAGEEPEEVPANAEDKKHDYNRKQQWLARNIAKRLATAMQANHGATEAERDAGRDIAWERSSPIVCKGRPGTGKTTVLLDKAKAAGAEGAQVLITVSPLLPYSNLASSC